MPKIPKGKSDAVPLGKSMCTLIFLFFWFSCVKLNLLYSLDICSKIKANIILVYGLKIFCYIQFKESAWVFLFIYSMNTNTLLVFNI